MNRFFILFSAVALLVTGTLPAYAQAKFKPEEYRPVTLNQLRLAPEKHLRAKVAFTADVKAFALSVLVDTVTKPGSHITLTMVKEMDNDKNFPIFIKKTNEVLNTFGEMDFSDPVKIKLFGSVKRVQIRSKEKPALPFTYYFEAVNAEAVEAEDTTEDIEEEEGKKADSAKEDKNAPEKEPGQPDKTTPVKEDVNEDTLPPKPAPADGRETEEKSTPADSKETIEKSVPANAKETEENPAPTDNKKTEESPEAKRPLSLDPPVKKPEAQPVTTESEKKDNEPEVKQPVTTEPEVKQQPVTTEPEKKEPVKKTGSVLKWE